jgi:hypothetical protein
MGESDRLKKIRKEIEMGLIDDLGIDPGVDENDFTVEEAAKVFEKAAEACKSGETAQEILDALLKAGLGVLKALA